MGDLAALDIQTKVAQALKQVSATDVDTSVRTHKLARRLKLLGVRLDLSKISVELHALAPTSWGKRYATFVGGTSDPLDQYIWALPKQE